MINKTLISVYPSCLSTLAHKDITLKEVYDIIRNDEVLRQRTVNYRKAIEADLSAKQLKKLKAEQFPMLMPAARFKDGRDMEHLDSYTYLCQCDIDNIAPDIMEEAKRRIRALPFVSMYHVSMSGNGLHIYYFYQIPNCGFTPQVYQQAFIQGNECIGNAIPADYDAAVGKANHGSSICHDPEAWINLEADPLKVDMTQACKKRGNLHRPIPLRTLCQILDKKGYQRMRNGNRRGYSVVELEATEINSRRMMVSADMPF